MQVVKIGSGLGSGFLCGAAVTVSFDAEIAHRHRSS